MATEIEFTPEETTVNDDLNGSLEMQIYLIDKYLEFSEKGDFYNEFQETLIKATIRAFRQIGVIQNSISQQLKKDSNDT